ncbi:MAG: thioredoxin family protein [Gemmatimonadota bacterium]|jgi:hypothetical protein
MKARFEAAPDFDEYLLRVTANRDLWRAVYERATVPDDLVTEAVRALDRPLHLLALSEDWCGDAVNILPVVARFVERVPGLDLRVLGRDANPDLMDAHLTDGRSRSIPVVIVFDEDFLEVGWWGPRPAELQAWVLDHLDMPSRERYREVRRWYARDRGRTTLTELLSVVMAGLATR